MFQRGLTAAVGLCITAAIVAPTAGAATFTTLYSFKGTPDGMYPSGDLALVNGELYGTTTSGGIANRQNAEGFGTLFQINITTENETVLYDFKGKGYGPTGAINIGNHLYGVNYSSHQGPSTTYDFNMSSGRMSIKQAPYYLNIVSPTLHDGMVYIAEGPVEGTGNGGGVFVFDPKTQAENNLYAFGGAPDGAIPSTYPTFSGGLIYGGTLYGGTYNEGTLYQLDPASGKETVLYSFTGKKDGGKPVGKMAVYKGSLYGTTFNCFGCNQIPYGTLFKFDLSKNSLSKVYQFTGKDGREPNAGLILYNGLLYGTTQIGGANNAGEIYQFDPATKAITVLYSFTGHDDGAYPDVLSEYGGTFYGVTFNGGAYDHGTVFSFTP